MEVLVEFGALGFDGFETFLREDVHEFVVDELHAFLGRIVVGQGGEGTLHIVDNGKDGFNHLLAAIDDKVGFFGIGAFAVVFVFGVEAEVFVVDFGQFLAHLLHFTLAVAVTFATMTTLFFGLGARRCGGCLLLGICFFLFLGHIMMCCF